MRIDSKEEAVLLVVRGLGRVVIERREVEVVEVEVAVKVVERAGVRDSEEVDPEV
jgi:hypothetical protein